MMIIYLTDQLNILPLILHIIRYLNAAALNYLNLLQHIQHFSAINT